MGLCDSLKFKMSFCQSGKFLDSFYPHSFKTNKNIKIKNFPYLCRLTFEEDYIPMSPNRSLLLGRQTSKWSLRDMVFHENNS